MTVSVWMVAVWADAHGGRFAERSLFDKLAGRDGRMALRVSV